MASERVAQDHDSLTGSNKARTDREGRVRNIAMKDGVKVGQCPTVDTISERVDELSGIVYTAPAKNGLIWKGEHPRGEVGDVAKFRFAFRKDFDTARSPVCDYIVPGKPGAGARLTLHALRPL